MVIEGLYGIGIPVRIDISLKTYDSFNAVAPLMDLIRIAKLLTQHGYSGAVKEVCYYYFKDPPEKAKSIMDAKKSLDSLLNKLLG
jgi:Myo-inositol-1-phosphate synthase